MVNLISTYIEGTLKKRSAKDLSNDAYAMFLWICFSECLYKNILWVLIWIASNSNEYPLHIVLWRSRQKYTSYNLETTELLDCALIGVRAVIRSSTVRIQCTTNIKLTYNLTSWKQTSLRLRQQIFFMHFKSSCSDESSIKNILYHRYLKWCLVRFSSPWPFFTEI